VAHHHPKRAAFALAHPDAGLKHKSRPPTLNTDPVAVLRFRQTDFPPSPRLSSHNNKPLRISILARPLTKAVFRLSLSSFLPIPLSQGHPGTSEFMSIENLKNYDPFADADEDTGETKQAQNYIHIRIQQRNGRKTLTTVQGLPKKFDQKKILKVIKKKFACNGTIVNDTEMGEVIQLQGDQRKDVQEFLIDKKEGLELDAKTIKVHGF
jgi:translation initiation factor SUI1